MKKKLLVAFIAVLALVCLFTIAVSAAQIGELNYTLTEGATESENTAKINKHENAIFEETDIVIPEYVEYEGKKYYVTAMADYTFKNTNITTVVFDDNCGITTIPSSAFYNCNDLTLIDFGKAKITTIGHVAFAYSEKLLFKDNRLPVAFREFSGTQHFDNCNAMTTLIFPSTFTYFNTDTRIQSTPIVNLVFEGEMTHVFLGYNQKHGYGGMNVYLIQNTVDDLNGSFVETIIHNNQPFFRNERDAYTTKTDGTLSITLSNNNANSGGNEYKDADGVQYSRVNTSQDRIYFCKDSKVVPIVRSSALTGSWTSGYMAVYDANALEVPEGSTTNPNVTYKLNPHFAEKTVVYEANCTYTETITTFCYCGAEMSKIVGTELGDHVYTVDEDCTTSHDCTVCQETIVEALSHALSTAVKYDEGYYFAGEKITACTNDGCAHKIVEELEALFTSDKGYSSELNGSGISHTIKVNREAIDAYVEITGSKVKYGTVAAVDKALGTPLSIDDEGKLVVANQAVVADMTGTNYSLLVIKMTGIPSGVQINCNAYIAIDSTVYYLCGKETLTEALIKQF